MRGGPSLKGKGGLVGFRRSLKVQGRTGGFSKRLLMPRRFFESPISRQIYKKIKHIF